jgi:hypothetical protein
VNERAVNVKQNQPHHPKTMPESGVFRENFCRHGKPWERWRPAGESSHLMPGAGRRDAGAPRKEISAVIGQGFGLRLASRAR